MPKYPFQVQIEWRSVKPARKISVRLIGLPANKVCILLQGLERKSLFRKHAEYGFVLTYLHGTCPRGCQPMFTPAPVASGIGEEILFVGP